MLDIRVEGNTDDTGNYDSNVKVVTGTSTISG